MDGQQVFVTGADGEQMVLSGPEAAALLAQAGISLGDQEQVMIGGQGQGESELIDINIKCSAIANYYYAQAKITPIRTSNI